MRRASVWMRSELARSKERCRGGGQGGIRLTASDKSPAPWATPSPLRVRLTRRKGPPIPARRPPNVKTRTWAACRQRTRAQDRAVAQGALESGPSLQPRADRIQSGKRGRSRRTPAGSLGIVAATVGARPPRLRKPQLQRNRPEAAADPRIAHAALDQRRIWIPGCPRQPHAVSL